MKYALPVLLALSSPAAASCGLEMCTLGMHMHDEAAPPATLTVDLSQTTFDLYGFDGDYVRTALRGDYRMGDWVFTGYLPLVNLTVETSAGDDKNSGLGNPVAIGEYVLKREDDFHATVGLQLEIPGGGADEGLGTDHFELIPFGSVMPRLGPGFGFGYLGVRWSLGDHHEDQGQDLIFVDPHSDKEILFKVGYAFTDMNPVRPEGFIAAQYVLEGPDDGETYWNGGVSLPWVFAKNWEFRPYFEAGIGTPRRFDSRAGARLAFYF